MFNDISYEYSLAAGFIMKLLLQSIFSQYVCSSYTYIKWYVWYSYK